MSSPDSADPDSSSDSRAGNTRRPLERIVQIHRAVSRGRYPNCSQLARDLETSRKTIQRDINFMRDSLALPLAYDEVQHGYHYTEPVSTFPFLQTTAEDLVSLVVARQSLRHLEDTPLVASLRTSLQRLQQGMHDRITIPWSDIDQAFSVKGEGLSQRDLGVFEKVSRAIMEQRELKFDYTKLESDGPERRHLRPFHLAEIDGGWYVIGHDVDRGARRTFAIQRMKGLTLTQRPFLRPADFRLEDHFAGSFGAWIKTEESSGRPLPAQRIRIRFRGFAARFVPERRWHPTQEVTRLDESGERIEVTMELNALQDITRWILSFGSQAEVIEPEELREAVARELDLARAQYSSS